MPFLYPLSFVSEGFVSPLVCFLEVLFHCGNAPAVTPGLKVHCVTVTFQAKWCFKDSTFSKILMAALEGQVTFLIQLIKNILLKGMLLISSFQQCFTYIIFFTYLLFIY